MKKTKVKFLLAFIVMLVAICLIGTGKVNAVEITDEILQEVANMIPDKIQLDLQEVEYEKSYAIIETEIKKSLDANNVEYNKVMSPYGYYNLELQGQFKGISIPLYDWGGMISRESMTKFNLPIQIDTNPNNNYNKTIELVYNNTDKYNKADEQAVKNIDIKPAGYYEVGFDKIGDLYEMFRVAGEYYTKQVNDNSIIVKAFAGVAELDNPLNIKTGESGTYIGIFKNGILYDVRLVGNDMSVPSITIPSNIPDDKITDYILNIVKPMYIEFFEENGIPFDGNLEVSKGAVYHFRESVSVNEDGTLNNKYVDVTIPDGYTVGIDGKGDYIIARKETSTSTVVKTDEETNIKLESNTSVIPNDTVLEVKPITDGIILSTVKESLNGISTEFKIYDITLKSNGTEIQPNGKVKISIPIPSDYNKDRLEVYRIADNGEKIRYEITIEGDYATFETDHFSTYVLAEREEQQGQTTNNEQTSNEHKLDETPKTGSVTVIGIIIAIAVISLAGIVIIKKNNK